MSDRQITTDYASQLDELRVITIDNGEVWSARDLMPFAGYTGWREFNDAINRAIASVNASGLDAQDHFVGVPKMVQIGSGARRQVEDVELTRYGCYILFQNADARKPEIAAAQQYFAVQTRKQELAPAETPETLFARALVAANGMLAQKDQAIEELTPRAEAWDRLASADGDFSVSEAAKMLARAGIETGPQRLFTHLRDMHWTFRSGNGNWAPYATIVDMGYLTSKPMSHEHPRTGERIIDPPQVRVTVKGLNQLRVRLSRDLKAVTA